MVVLTFESVDKILSVTIQMKAIEQYFAAAIFYTLKFAFKNLGSERHPEESQTQMCNYFTVLKKKTIFIRKIRSSLTLF